MVFNDLHSPRVDHTTHGAFTIRIGANRQVFDAC